MKTETQHHLPKKTTRGSQGKKISESVLWWYALSATSNIVSGTAHESPEYEVGFPRSAV
jgi:hypothetical protein